MKKLVKFMTSFITVLCLSISAFAFNSITTDLTVIPTDVTDEVGITGFLEEGHTLWVVIEGDIAEAALPAVQQINGGAKIIDVLPNIQLPSSVTKDDIKDATAVAEIINVEVKEVVGDKPDGEFVKYHPECTNVPVTFAITLPNDSTTENTWIIHYSVARGVWEIIDAKSIDAKNGLISVVLPDLSPVGVIYGGSASVTPDNPSTPDNNDDVPTGDHNNIALYTSLAVAAGALACYIVYKKKEA